jgi:hypothetical protein
VVHHRLREGRKRDDTSRQEWRYRIEACGKFNRRIIVILGVDLGFDEFIVVHFNFD